MRIPWILLERLRTCVSAALAGACYHWGERIWVIGSTFVGHGCFTCITGEAYPTEDYEIDEVLEARPPRSEILEPALSNRAALEEDPIQLKNGAFQLSFQCFLPRGRRPVPGGFVLCCLGHGLLSGSA